MPRILRSSSQRKRSQWHHTLQSIKNLVPTISAKPTHPTETLDQREFLAVLHLMPVKYTVKPIFTHGSKEAKKCREWCDQMDQYCLKRDIDIGVQLRAERSKYQDVSEAREHIHSKVFELVAEKRRLGLQLEEYAQENLRLKCTIKYLEYMTKLVLAIQPKNH